MGERGKLPTPLLRSAIVAALVLSLLVGPSAVVMAQADEVTPAAAGINAETVDGKDAVAATNKAAKRANKLVAANRLGLLPSNILKPLWGFIQGIPAVLADGQVAFAEIAGMPPPFADGQVAFAEVTGTPAGFADGVDNEGVTAVKIRTVTSTTPVTIASNFIGSNTADCPAGFLAVGGGHVFEGGQVDLIVYESKALDADTWRVSGYKTSLGASSANLSAQVICMRAEPAGIVIAAKNSSYGPKKALVRQPK